jgi:hypothetical protein
MFDSRGVVMRMEEVRDLARRARRLASVTNNADDRPRLLKYAEQLEAEADRLDRQASSPSPMVIAPLPQSNGDSRPHPKAASKNR